MKDRIGNIIFLIVISILSLLYYLQIMGFPHPEEKIVIPLLFWVLLVLVIINIIQILLEIRQEEGFKKAFSNCSNLFSLNKIRTNNKAVLLISVLLYFLLIVFFGFFIPSFIFFIYISWFLGTKKVPTLILVPLIILGFTYLFFIRLLNISMPKGIIF